MKVTDEIYALVPEEYRDKCGINWNGKSNKFYVFLRVGYRYDPAKKRSVDLREPLGSIQDGVFTYGPSFAKKMKISSLEKQVKELQKKDEKKSEKPKNTALKSNEATANVNVSGQNTKSALPLAITLSVAMLASFGGITDAVSISLYSERCRKELEILFDDFPDEPISQDTIKRIFCLLDPDRLNLLLESMVQPLLADNAQRLIHIDDQAVRASKADKSEDGRHHFDIENSLHLVLDNDFSQDSIHSGDSNYLSNRIFLSELAHNILQAVQGYYKKKDGRELRLEKLMLLCATPAGALKILSEAISLKSLLTYARA